MLKKNIYWSIIKIRKNSEYPEMYEAPSFFEPTSTLTGTQHRRPDVRPSLCSGRQKVC